MKIKVITFNIWHGGKLMDNVLSFLKREDPDIVFLQEVYNGKDPNYEPRYRTVEILQEKTKLPFFAFTPTFLAIYGEVRADRGNAIFSKFPLSKEKDIYLISEYRAIENEDSLGDWRKVPRLLQQVSVQLNDKKVALFNNHGVWDFHGNDSPDRFHMSEVIIDNTKHKENVIVAGDFNLRSDTQAVYNIERHLKNVFKDELSSTFNMKHKTDKGFAASVVDMMFVSPNIKVVNHYCPDVDISDHLPLVQFWKFKAKCIS